MDAKERELEILALLAALCVKLMELTWFRRKAERMQDICKELNGDRLEACPTGRLWTFYPGVSAACWSDIYGQAT
jgi:hypothetical protein